MRDRIRTQAQTELPGELSKIVKAIIQAADADELPKRLLLGSDAYALVRAALAGRLAAIEAQRETAFATDAEDFAA